MTFAPILRAAVLLLVLAGAAACQSTSGASGSMPAEQKAGSGY